MCRISFVALVLSLASVATFHNAGANLIDSEKTSYYSPDLDSRAVGKYLSADYAFRHNDPETAAALFMDALEQSPENSVLLQSTYKLLLFSGQIDEAMRYAGKYLEYEKKSVSANILLAIGAINEGEFDQAQSYLDTIENDHVKNILSGVDLVIVPFLRMWVHVGRGNYDDALKVASRLSNYDTVSSLFIHYQNALISDMAGYFKKAEKEYATSLSGDRSPYHFVKAAGNFYERIQKPEQAGALYTDYRKRYPQLDYFSADILRLESAEAPGALITSPSDGVVEVLMEAVRLLYKSGLYKEALAYLQLILYLSPDNVETKVLLSSYYEEFEQYDMAVELYKTIPEDSDFYWASRINMAEGLYKLGEKSMARNQLNQLAERNSKNYSALLILGDLLRKDKEFDDAAEVYTKILDRLSDIQSHHWPVFFARGICYERSKRWPEAEKDLIKALELNPGQPEVLNYLGYSWIDRNEHIEKAKEMVQAAVRARPNDAQIIDSMGWVLFKLKNYDEAAKYIERAVELLPKDVIINDHLGDIYWRQGRLIEARFQWQRAQRYGPEPLSAEYFEKKIQDGLQD